MSDSYPDYPRPSWATKYTPRGPTRLGMSMEGPFREFDLVSDYPVNHELFFNGSGLTWELVDITSHRRRPRWWWPFGKPQWVVSFFLRPVREPADY
jgi:hypothetical protein